jgi:hypothetical protein
MGLLQRRAARPGDRPARHRSCAPDQSDACLGGRALPDPPAREGRQSPGGALVTVPLGSPRRPIHVTRGCRAARRRARHTAPLHRLDEPPQQGPCAPRFGGALSAVCLVGVGRCPTRRPGRAGHDRPWVRCPVHGPSYQGQRSRCARPCYWPVEPSVCPPAGSVPRGRRAAGGRPEQRVPPGEPRRRAQPGAAPGVRLLSLPPCSWPSGGAEAAERAVRPRSPAHRRVRAAAPRPCSGRRRPRSPNPSASGHRNSPGIGQ